MTEPTPRDKPLGRKAYGSIPHLPGSRPTPGDHHISPGQADICQHNARSKQRRIIVQEKLDGACTAVAKTPDGNIIALSRSGQPARSHPFAHIRLFANWVDIRQDEFDYVLRPGWRIVGEWMAVAHGIRYDLPHDLWAYFDVFDENNRRLTQNAIRKADDRNFRQRPATVHDGGPVPATELLASIGRGYSGAAEAAEGLVYRVENGGQVEFLAKYVRHDLQPGRYMIQEPGDQPVWNMRQGKVITARDIIAGRI